GIVTAIVNSGMAKTQLISLKPPRSPMIVGNAVATIALSTAGMNVAISAAARIIRRRGTTAAGRNSSATLWSNATASDLGTSADFRGTLPCRQRAAGAGQQSALRYRLTA